MIIESINAVIVRIDEKGIVREVSYGTPVDKDKQFYKDIPISPMTYGQALTMLCLIEGLRHLK
ncbi:glycoside hydrolase family 88 protein [Paenibacillus sp. GP183]|uniref:glycoside hydrolase family 88 protein n=1 Tax=Paenibacillus sp. GP183 TaxID=1882751 RepID=UPI001C0E18AB|nr:glycoside hydrolase family 88 protein [Paenibacillus sp. GP183]